ncbi:unnamed protein product, partial [Prorocentrum cordatum]
MEGSRVAPGDYVPVSAGHQQALLGELAEPGRGVVHLACNTEAPFRVVFSHSEGPTRGRAEVLCFVVGKRRNSVSTVGFGNPYQPKKQHLECTYEEDARLSPQQATRDFWFLVDASRGLIAFGAGAPMAETCRALVPLSPADWAKRELIAQLRYVYAARAAGGSRAWCSDPCGRPRTWRCGPPWTPAGCPSRGPSARWCTSSARAGSGSCWREPSRWSWTPRCGATSWERRICSSRCTSHSTSCRGVRTLRGWAGQRCASSSANGSRWCSPRRPGPCSLSRSGRSRSTASSWSPPRGRPRRRWTPTALAWRPRRRRPWTGSGSSVCSWPCLSEVGTCTRPPAPA